MRFPSAKWAIALLGCSATGLSCQTGLDDPEARVVLDEAYFRCRVQPVLAKSCGAFACHGDGRRYFRVFARNRLRAAGEEKDRNAPLSALESRFNHAAAKSFVDPSSPEESYLLMKPLDASAGGAFHRGAEIFGGGNVFLTVDDPDYRTLVAWATKGAKEDPSCVEPGSDL